jgi:hypothetical protein
LSFSVFNFKLLKIGILQEILEQSLNLTNSEATHIVSQLDQYFASKNVNGSGEKSAKRVKFNEDREGMSAASFLSCFHCQTHLLDQDTAHHGSYELLNNLSDEKRSELGRSQAKSN